MVVIYNNNPITIDVSLDQTEIELSAGANITINNSTLPVSTDSSLTGDGTGGSPLSVAQSTESQIGGAEVATQAETDAGTDDTKIVTPLKLANFPGLVAPVDSVFGRTGVVVAQASDYDADQVDYDNTTSGLSATEVQSAIDEIDNRIDGLEALGRYRGTHDASTGLPPTPASSTVLPGQPINAGDYWKVSVAGTIVGINGKSSLDIFDTILADINNATLAGDFTGLDTSGSSTKYTASVILSAGANVINHNLGTRWNAIDIRNATTGEKVLFVGVTATSTTQTTIDTFIGFDARILITSGF